MATGAKDYEAIAKRKIQRPANVKRGKKILVYSRPKKGKTTFLMKANQELGREDAVLIVDPEGGTDPYTKQNPHVWPVTEWTDLDDVLGFLRTGKHNYEVIGVDGLTKIYNMALRFVMKQAMERDITRQPNDVAQRDYGRANEMLKEFLEKLRLLPQTVIYTCHERMISVSLGDDEDEEASGNSVQYVPELPKGAKAAIVAYTDVIGRLYTVKTDVKLADGTLKEGVTQRRLWIGVNESYDTGGRTEFDLPDYIKNPSPLKLIRLMADGVSRTVAKKATTKTTRADASGAAATQKEVSV